MISDNHLLSEASQKPIPGGKPMPVRRAVVIHFTAGATAQSSIDWWKKPQNRQIDLGAHIIIDRDGTIYQCRPFNKTISHAGKSRWVDPKTGKKYTSCNGFTIGIELANAGDDPAVIKIAKTLPGYAGTAVAKHRNGGSVKAWEKYPDAQFLSCINVVNQLVERYHLDDCTGHDCIAPERKSDPGPVFDMEALRMTVGMNYLPVVHWP
jgi:N-acetylmuramoyl-L-alanine amidase